MSKITRLTVHSAFFPVVASSKIDRNLDLHIWQLNLDELDDDPILLSAAERERAARFVRPTHARRYVQAHCGLRRIISAAVGIEPNRLDFLTSETGKPRLSTTPGFEFNLSHSGGWALIATADARVGVDIEVHRDIDDLTGVARSIMSVRELHHFESAHPREQRRLFFDVWTHKEALLKASGKGFSEDPRTLDVDASFGVAEAVFAQTHWTVARLNVGAELAAAIAIENPESHHISMDVIHYNNPK